MRANSLIVDFVGTALVVPAKYSPEYVFVPERGGNHVFRIKPNRERTFEYMMSAGWSEGVVNRNTEELHAYTRRAAEELNAPPDLVGPKLETRAGRPQR